MITSWKLKNFKSAFKETELVFKPLTIFAGANSSGKSTIIQSILLTTQTIQNPVFSKSVILNGHISKFGTYNDLLSKGATSESIKIGFDLEPKSPPDESALDIRRFYYQHDEELQKLKCTFNIDFPKDEIQQLQPILGMLEIESFRRGIKNAERNKITIKKSRKSIAERIDEYKIKTLSKIEENALEYEVEIPIRTQYAYHFYRMPLNFEIVGANLSHFLPYRFTGIYNTFKNQIHQLDKVLTGQLNYLDLNFIEDEVLVFNNEFKDFVLNVFEEVLSNIDLQKSIGNSIFNNIYKNVEDLKSDFTKTKLAKCLKNRHFQKYTSSLFIEKKAELFKVFKDIDNEKYITAKSFPVHLPEVEFIEIFFKKNVKYLGPLRDDPKSVYPLEGYLDPTDVGFRGENTAAVLDIHKNLLINYIQSEEFNSNFESKTIKNSTLQFAVMDWLQYLGVASSVNTSDKGTLGHELKVTTDESGNLLDLTHVGVGVSQILPILVLSLLAQSDTTLIFEQPELHLHPKVQTRLADFFLSMNMLGKQCIVETHSEYLINRLRYLVATSEGTKISDNSILYFVEKHNSESKYKPIHINPYGVIENWPKGFFDENETIAAQVLKASLEKYKKDKQKK